MALMSCPECNKEISDKSKNCVYCGYPVSKYKLQNFKIGERTYDLSFVLDNTITKKEKIIKFQDLSGYGLKESMYFVLDLYEEYDIIDNVNMQTNIVASKDCKPHCPTCNSTNLNKISTTSKVMNTAVWGILGTKRHKTFHCNSCGYEW